MSALQTSLAFLSEIENELQHILTYWSTQTVDDVNGGFIGEIDFNEQKNHQAEKGSVMYGRILWAFSAAYLHVPNSEYLKMADRAFEGILNYFYNPVCEGIYWSINPDGSPKDTKNQIYALSFVMYGLSEYHKITQNQQALNLAITLFHSIQNHSLDAEKGGYFEALTADWKEIEDMRLSDKDANEKKTMNTHLHIVEGFTNLYTVWKNEELRKAIVNILETIDEHFIDKETWHLKLFFNEDWVERKDVISYGHDIEAAWLLQWCAEISEDENLIDQYRNYAVKMAEATKEGIDADGGLWYEYNPQTHHLVTEKHWWPQAELWIGYANAFQLTGNKEYIEILKNNWQFTEKYIVDHQHGEWFWGVDKDYHPIEKDKAGFWKCPYHNSRACLEVVKRLKNTSNNQQ